MCSGQVPASSGRVPQHEVPVHQHQPTNAQFGPELGANCRELGTSSGAQLSTKFRPLEYRRSSQENISLWEHSCPRAAALVGLDVSS